MAFELEEIIVCTVHESLHGGNTLGAKRWAVIKIFCLAELPLFLDMSVQETASDGYLKVAASISKILYLILFFNFLDMIIYNLWWEPR